MMKLLYGLLISMFLFQSVFAQGGPNKNPARGKGNQGQKVGKGFYQDIDGILNAQGKIAIKALLKSTNADIEALDTVFIKVFESESEVESAVAGWEKICEERIDDVKAARKPSTRNKWTKGSPNSQKIEEKLAKLANCWGTLKYDGRRAMELSAELSFYISGNKRSIKYNRRVADSWRKRLLHLDKVLGKAGMYLGGVLLHDGGGMTLIQRKKQLDAFINKDFKDAKVLAVNLTACAKREEKAVAGFKNKIKTKLKNWEASKNEHLKPSHWSQAETNFPKVKAKREIWSSHIDNQMDKLKKGIAKWEEIVDSVINNIIIKKETTHLKKGTLYTMDKVFEEYERKLLEMRKKLR